MPTRYLFVLLCFFSAHALAGDDPLASLKKGQPRDVRDLIDRLAACTHWSGEEPYDAERQREISLAMKNLKCSRLEKDEAAARKRYAKQPRTIEVLQQAKDWSD
jgi:hypothetical protein